MLIIAIPTYNPKTPFGLELEAERLIVERERQDRIFKYERGDRVCQGKWEDRGVESEYLVEVYGGCVFDRSAFARIASVLLARLAYHADEKGKGGSDKKWGL
jgi:hypothetical protein